MKAIRAEYFQVELFVFKFFGAQNLSSFFNCILDMPSWEVKVLISLPIFSCTLGHLELNAQVPTACSHHSRKGLQPLWFEKGILLYLRLSRNKVHGSDCLSKPKGEYDLLMICS